MSGIPRRALAAWAVMVLLSTAFLYFLVAPAGVELEGDSRYYILGAIHLARDGRFLIEKYLPWTDEIVPEGITAYPPGTSAAYAALIRAGIHPSLAPSVLSLLCWPLVLSAAALLVYRRSGSAVLAGCAIVLASLSVPFLEVYKAALSEVLFLPILLGALLLFTEMGRNRTSSRWGIALGAGLMGAMVLTRYAGVFVCAGLTAWLVWRRLEERDYLLCIRELPILALPALPVLLWVLWNERVEGSFVGAEIGRRDYTWADAFSSILRESTWLVLPSIRRHHLAVWLEGNAAFVYVALGIVLAYALWRGGALLNPAPIVAAFYLVPFVVWTLPFSNLMNTRFVTVLLCLFQINLLSSLASLPRRWMHPLAFGYLLLNFVLLLAAWPLAKTEPPAHAWTTTPPRARDLAVSHGELLEHLDRFEGDLVVLADTEAMRMFAPYEIGVYRDFETWLESGTCSPGRDLAVVSFRRWGDPVSGRSMGRDLEAETITKCGPTPRMEFPRSTVMYVRKRLDLASGISEQAPRE